MILGQTQPFASPQEALVHVSEAPWSDYSKTNYTVEQWHAACLIHLHDGAPTSKNECKLPVKTPNGVLNRNGVHAAAAALAGARGGLKGVSADQKQKAANALKRYYSQLDEEPPESLAQHSEAGWSHQTKPGSPNDILEHYGVKGMRWGVRKEEETSGRTSAARIEPVSRGPGGKAQSTPSTSQAAPPPLSERNQNRVDKFLKRADVMDTTISQLNARNEQLQGTNNPAKRYERSANNQAIRDLQKAKNQALKDAEAVKQGKLTSTQKKVIIGAAAVGVIGAGVLISRGQQSGALNSYQLLAQARLRGQELPFNVNPKLSKAMKAEDLLTHVAKPVNPGYSSMGGKMNCRRSTYAYELRRRGFDVHATTSSSGWGQSESGVINALTPGSKNFYRSMSVSEAVMKTRASTVASGDRRTNPVQKILLDKLIERAGPGLAGGGDPVSSSKRVIEELAKQPNGARGEVLFKFPTFGHSMAYEVVDGVPHIFDSQKGTMYNAATKMVESKWDGFHSAEITRLDNADLDLNFLTRWATNVGGK
jgi:hypothetical protein